MLGRASRARVPPIAHRSLLSSYNELYLPWLCPSICAANPRPRRTATTSQDRHAHGLGTRKTNPSKPNNISICETRRGLASAAVADYVPPHDEYVPFEAPPSLFGTLQNPNSPFRPRTFDHHLPGVFDPRDSILVDDSITTAPAIFKTFNAISGEIAEIHQTLHACLQVGRLARAVALMRRLSTLYKPDAPGLLAAHNDYVRELTYRLSRTKDQQMLKDVQNWFEVSLRGKGVIPDATTYALMVQAAFQDSDVKKVGRTIRRYVHLAEEAGVLDETVANVSSTLDDENLGLFNESLPAQYAQVDDIVPDLPSPLISRPAFPSSEGVSTSRRLYDTPEIRPVDTKGLGLEALRQSLSLFSDAAPAHTSENPTWTQEEREKEQNMQRQRILERDTFASAMDRWREESVQQKKLGINASLQTPSIGSLMWNWHEELVPLIREEVGKANEAEEKSQKSAADKERCYYGPFLQYLSPEKLSAVTILSSMSLLSMQHLNRGARLAQLVLRIGDTVQDESIAETLRVNQDRMYKNQKPPDRLAKIRAFVKRRNPRNSSYINMLGADKTLSAATESLRWSKPIRTKVGTILLWHLMNIAKTDVVSSYSGSAEVLRERQPVFFHSFQYMLGKRTGLVRFNKAIASKMATEPVKSVLSRHLPMVVEPKPWTDFRDGGFLEHSIPVVRIRNMDLGRRYAITASANGDMNHLFAGLDVLGKTPWRINRPVFEAMVEAWNSGNAIAKIPPEDPTVDLPPEPPLSEPLSDNAASRYKWMRQIRAIENLKSGQRSNRCFQNFQLEVARAYMNETFYFPHNVDFRGRAYPLSPFFNHMGADNVRGLLIFAQGKELGAAGLSWLKIHLANLYGYDKASFKERRDFAMEHLADIYDSANNPMHGDKWWLKAEDPWQCLGACIELKNALDSPDPQKFISHLPIHQDGTCNGLQHYAALGGDVIGAKQVNLEPGDRPSDIYTAVAEIVKAEVVKDAARGDHLAKILEGRVTRKVVKQTVMTNVYGVTFLGAKRQVRRQLDDVFALSPDPALESTDAASFYVAKKIFKALSSMFNGAHDIQYWFGDCASRISQSLSPEQIDSLLRKTASTKHSQFQRPPSVGKVSDGPTTFKTPVIWTNPLRMPVVQPYRAAAPKSVSTNLQSITLQCPTQSDPVSKRKQLQGFPPNFIHSLDASHMILTALKCNEAGLTFASVHDSFWTHAANVETMNGIIRDTFITMHTEDIIGRLAAEFATRYKGFMYLASVKKSSALGKEITKWRKQFPVKQGLSSDELKIKELGLEKHRYDLLSSNNPDEKAEGAAMITPAQLFEATADETELVPEGGLEGTGIGEMPSARTTKLQANEQIEVGDLNNAKVMDPKSDEPDDHDLEFSDLPGIEQSIITEGGDTEAERCSNTKPTKPKRSAPVPTIRFWLPMSFPPVPKKGDFDVSRLKRSPYFFS